MKLKVIICIMLGANLCLANDFDTIARRSVNASWDNSTSWAHYLVINEVVNSFSSVLFETNEGMFNSINYRREDSLYRNVLNKYDELYEEARASDDYQKLLKEILNEYRNTLALQYYTSWEVMEKQHAQPIIKELLMNTIQRFKDKCAVGHSHVNAGVNVPNINVPDLAFSMRISPDLNNVVSVSINASSGDYDSRWQKDKNGLKTVAMVASTSVPGGPVIVEMVFFALDSIISAFESKRLQRKIIRANNYIKDNRAKGEDITRFYREYCSLYVDAFDNLMKYIERPQEYKEYASGQAFVNQFKQWLSKNQETSSYSCKVGLYDSYKNGSCLKKGSAYREPRLITLPVCEQVMEGSSDSVLEKSCPKSLAPQDSMCRIDNHKLFHLSKSDDDICVINDVRGYKCSEQHLEDLRKAGRNLDVEICEIEEEKRLEKQNEEQRIENVANKTYERCIESNNNAEACEDRAEYIRSEETRKSEILNVRKEELENEVYQLNRKHRERQRKDFIRTSKETSEMVGLFFVKSFYEHEDIMEYFFDLEEKVNIHRLALREKILEVIDLMSQDPLDEISKERQYYDYQKRFLDLSARSIRNIMSGQSNEEVLYSLDLLKDEISNSTVFDFSYSILINNIKRLKKVLV